MNDFVFSLTPDGSKGNSVRSFHELPVAPAPDNKIGALPFGKFAYGNEVWGDGVQEMWLHVLEVDGHAVDGWIAETHLGKKIATITQLKFDEPLPEPDPAPAPTPGVVDVSVSVGGANVGRVFVNSEEYLKK